MAVKAKFRVIGIAFMQVSVQRNGGYVTALARKVDLQPVGNSGNPEDVEFWSATPMGSCTMTIANEAAAEQFELNGEYYVTFEKAKDGQPIIVNG